MKVYAIDLMIMALVFQVLAAAPLIQNLGNYIIFGLYIASIILVFFCFIIVMRSKQKVLSMQRHRQILLTLAWLVSFTSVFNMALIDRTLTEQVNVMVQGVMIWLPFLIGFILSSSSQTQIINFFKIMTICFGFVLLNAILDTNFSVLDTVNEELRMVVFSSMESRSAYHVYMALAFSFFALAFIYSAFCLIRWSIGCFLLGLFVSIFVVIFFGKRAPLVDAGIATLIFVTVTVIVKNSNVLTKIAKLLVLSGFAIAGFFGFGFFIFGPRINEALLESFDRFNVDHLTKYGQSYAGEDRIIELVLYWDSLNPIQKLLGGGIGYQYEGVVDGLSLGTHIGWSNLHVVGGFGLVYYALFLCVIGIRHGVAARRRMICSVPDSQNEKNKALVFNAGLLILIAISMSHSTVIGGLTAWIIGFSFYGSFIINGSRLNNISDNATSSEGR